MVRINLIKISRSYVSEPFTRWPRSQYFSHCSPKYGSGQIQYEFKWKRRWPSLRHGLRRLQLRSKYSSAGISEEFKFRKFDRNKIPVKHKFQYFILFNKAIKFYDI